MNIRPVLAISASLLCLMATADSQQEFNAAYEAYRDAVSAEQYHLAAEPVAEARRIGESLCADNPRTIDAAKEFRYAPRFVDGQPVAVEGVRNRIVFRKRD